MQHNLLIFNLLINKIIDMQIQGKSFSQLKKRLLTKNSLASTKIFQQPKRKKFKYSSTTTQIFDQNKKILANLQRSLQQQTKRREKAEKQLNEWKQKCVVKQIQLRNVIHQYQQEKIVIKSSSLQQMHTKIQDNIAKSNIQTQKWLQEKYNQNLFLMERRINQLKKKIEIEMQKQKKLSLQSYHQIISQMEYTKNIAKNIDETNIKLIEELKQIKLKNVLLQEQRKLLIQQIIQKKQLIKKLIFENKSNLNKTQRIHSTTKFIGEPSFTPHRKMNNSAAFNIEQMSPILKRKTQKSIQNLKRNLTREKKRNFELSLLFGRNSAKNKQINDILWQCIQQTKKDVQNNNNSQFHSSLISNIAKSEKLILNINELRELKPKITKIDTEIEKMITQKDFLFE